MTTESDRALLEAARRGDEAAFGRLVEPYRRELHAHCYRMLGSVQDAEDALQETLLRAWRGLRGFEGRSSLRSWLYKIATNACLKTIERRPKRVLPIDYAPASDPHDGPAEPVTESVWLEPYPDERLGLDGGLLGPDARYEQREAVELAFIAALQHLPARQRAVLILRDVLAWRTSEVAELIGASEAAVNSALQRARTQLRQVAPTEDEVTEPSEASVRELLDQYATAFETADITTLTRLLAQDAVFEMPPIPTWFAGRDRIARFLVARVLVPDHFRLLGTHANGQPAFGLYLRNEAGEFLPHAIQVLTLADRGIDRGIARVVTFHDPDLLPRFGLLFLTVR